jgi:1-hydroxycarotenoid 3,4-desaturase
MRKSAVVVVGAGIGGLAAALELAVAGLEVTVLERQPGPGGKMREVAVGGRRLDAGPTVLTMRQVFEDLFARAGADLSSRLHLMPASVLARHAWSASETLDLHADLEQSVEAISRFAGLAEGGRYRRFCTEARAVFTALDDSFIRGSRPGPVGLVRRSGWRGLPGLWRIRPFTSLWRALGGHFHDPRLRQLFARYATYCGSSPFLSPATLMLVAHVEQAGVWLVEGGMHRLAQALAALARERGVSFRFETEVASITRAGAGVSGVCLRSGEALPAGAVVVNADAAAVAAGLFGELGRPIPPVPVGARSLSAVTWLMSAPTAGFPLSRHSVFFSRDYAREFRELHGGNLPSDPTVYVCAQDRDDLGQRLDRAAEGSPERLLCLVNAPATGDLRPLDSAALEDCTRRCFATLERCGLHVDRSAGSGTLVSPEDFHQLFPGTGGALYGRASHGWMASFQRPGARTRVPGLYLAGGSTHPGPGVPMAALSGIQAAREVLRDLHRQRKA